MKNFKSLKSRLIVSCTVIMIITVVASFAISVITSRASIEQNVSQDLHSIGQMANVAVTNSLDKIKYSIQCVGGLDYINQEGVSSGSCLSKLDGIKNIYGFTQILVADNSGKVYSNDEDINGKSVAGKVYFTNAMQGLIYLSSTTTDLKGKPAVIVSAPITNGKYVGVVIGIMDVQTYSNIIKDIRIGKNGNVFMIDKTGTIIANMRPQLVTDRTNFIEKAKKDPSYTSAAHVYSNMVAQKSNFETYNYGGERYCYYEPLKGTDGWSYGAVAPVDEMMAPVQNTIFWMGIASAVFIILSVIGAYFVAGTIASPISLVCGKLERLAEGDLNTEPVIIKAKDETGILANSLNTTVANLRQFISEITEVLQKIAQGDMSAKIERDLQGDFQPIQQSINTITSSLNAVLTNIDLAAAQVSSSSSQVSNGASLLSENTTRQAGATEELSSTIFDLATKTSQNSESAAQASSITQKARTAAETGNGYMKEMLESMQQINVSSENISKIIKVIEDISFQTNILALNAAVEAARAGEAGKGFAVVADEVRNLANKSAKAAKETTALIEDTISKVEHGTQKANQAADALNEVVSHVEKSDSMVMQIAQVSKQQATALEEVKAGINQITEAVQTNSATSEESAAASEEMRSQAQELKEQIAQFKLQKLESEEDINTYEEPEQYQEEIVDEESGKHLE